MVTTGLASHWPSIIDCGISTYGLNSLRKGDEQLTYSHVGAQRSVDAVISRQQLYALWHIRLANMIFKNTLGVHLDANDVRSCFHKFIDKSQVVLKIVFGPRWI